VKTQTTSGKFRFARKVSLAKNSFKPISNPLKSRHQSETLGRALHDDNNAGILKQIL